MTAYTCEDPRFPWGVVLICLLLVSFFTLTGCGKAPEKLPPPPAEVIEVAVAVPVPCEIADVAVPAYPAAQARKGDDIYTLTKIALADRKVRMGENVELRAANDAPCGETK